MVYGYDVKVDGVWIKAGEEVKTSSSDNLSAIESVDVDVDTSKRKGGRPKKVED